MSRRKSRSVPCSDELFPGLHPGLVGRALQVRGPVVRGSRVVSHWVEAITGGCSQKPLLAHTRVGLLVKRNGWQEIVRAIPGEEIEVAARPGRSIAGGLEPNIWDAGSCSRAFS